MYCRYKLSKTPVVPFTLNKKSLNEWGYSLVTVLQSNKVLVQWLNFQSMNEDITCLLNDWIFTHWPRIVLCSTVSKEFPHSFNDSFLRVLTLIIQLWKNYPLIQLCGVCTNLRDGFDLNVILPNGKGHHCVLQLSSTRYWWGLCKRTFVDHFSFKWSDDLRLCGVHADLAKLDEG